MLDEEIKRAVKKQIEFYFSDSNLPRDKFLKAKTSENPDGFVELALICTFSRMQGLLKLEARPGAGNIADEVLDAVADALKDSEIIGLSQDRRKVHRSKTLQDDAEISREADKRTLYVAPFPFDTGLDSLTDFFNSHGCFNCIRMRRHVTSKDFKGSIFLELASDEEAAKLQKLSLVFEGAPLKMEPKLDYVARKEVERRSDLNSPAIPSHDPSPGIGNGTGYHGAEPNDAAVHFEQGCVLYFNFGEATEFTLPITFGLVKDSFGGRDAGVAYVEYQQNGKSGYVRFASPEAAAGALASSEDGTMMIAGYPASVCRIEREEEKDFHARAAVASQETRDARGKGGKRGRQQQGGGKRKRL